MSLSLQQTMARLDARRKKLGMSMSALAEHSGVSLPTVQRVLRGSIAQASYRNVSAIAEALGMTADLSAAKSEDELREEQAERKARQLVGMVQATSGLESQAVDREQVEAMVRRTVHELLAGSSGKLWAA